MALYFTVRAPFDVARLPIVERSDRLEEALRTKPRSELLEMGQRFPRHGAPDDCACVAFRAHDFVADQIAHLRDQGRRRGLKFSCSALVTRLFT